jgi:hypothetical protein
MRGTNDLDSHSIRSLNGCDGEFCETWSFPQQFEKVLKKMSIGADLTGMANVPLPDKETRVMRLCPPRPLAGEGWGEGLRAIRSAELLSATQEVMEGANQGDWQRVFKAASAAGMVGAADVNPALMTSCRWPSKR